MHPTRQFCLRPTEPKGFCRAAARFPYAEFVLSISGAESVRAMLLGCEQHYWCILPGCAWEPAVATADGIFGTTEFTYIKVKHHSTTT
jgi:hypothetical protein